jgi:hypothetical protein
MELRELDLFLEEPVERCIEVFEFLLERLTIRFADPVEFLFGFGEFGTVLVGG